MPKVYLIGSLANAKIPHIANRIRKAGFEVFDQWWAPGKFADSYWRHYTKIRGLSFKEALRDYAGSHIFNFDKGHIDNSDIAVLCLPAGRSGHMELGYAIGKGKKGYILFESEPIRYDVMYGFATDIFFNEKDLIKVLRGELNAKSGTEQVGHTISAAS